MSRVRMKLAIVLLLVGTAAAQASAGPHYATSDSGSERRSEAYRDGQRALDSEEWDDASRIFGKLARRIERRNRRGALLEGLRRLETEARRRNRSRGCGSFCPPTRKRVGRRRARPWSSRSAAASERGSTPDADNEELKLYALDGLMQVEPEQAVPVLEKLLAGNSSQRIKERALFVLSQSDSPRAREILLRTAKSGQPIALRCEAVKTLGHRGRTRGHRHARRRSPRTRRHLRKCGKRRDRGLPHRRPARRAARHRQKSDPDPRIRAKAIDALGAIGLAALAAAALEHREGPCAPREAPRGVRRRRGRRDPGEGGAGELGPAAPQEGDRRARDFRQPRRGQALRQMYGSSPTPRTSARSSRP